MRDDPFRLVRHGARPSCTTPEPGWSSQCTREVCPGFWRTGLASEDQALTVYAEHVRAEHLEAGSYV